jgi:glucosamine-phosphate N-acetyltransferase
MASESLFSSDLLSPAVSEALPQGYKIRSLRRTDYDTGFLDCLRVLTTVGDISQSQWEEQYDWFKKRDGGYYMLVVEDDKDRVVGCGTLVVERKLYVLFLSLQFRREIGTDSSDKTAYITWE